ncbi:MAG: decarboxylating NADP(+)-dependent phosphogluconate dehydrogenase [Oscillospiraceae bacterium]|nr:decarboxylating NADP(+)-dependent phosphogluconate dehydrogenase [Oscillospiraceae bacterium]MDD4369060.1 decarboxylating NADP(+)-dependent phosphogluconate dehydrogenase [Oscillospiraceae bacterium]
MSETVKSDIGVIGLAVMGENLALNLAGHGFRVSVYNRTTDKVTAFMAGRARGLPFTGCLSVREFVDSLTQPRKILMMVKAGRPVDLLMDQLLPFLQPGDILIDGGNSHYPDTQRRLERAEANGLLYVGMGVSGGEEGALNGPSLMPGGSADAWPELAPLLQAIAAKAPDGSPCCDWVGEGGSGHFVKMVHNGIEYGDMQLIAESYDLLRHYLALEPEEIAQVLNDWNQGELNSYLIEISARIMQTRDQDGSLLLDKILDKAGQKGTGKWTSAEALEQSVPLTLIAEAVFARFLSAEKDERLKAAQLLRGPEGGFQGTAAERQAFISDLEQALYASKLISYTQGYVLLREAARQFGWKLNYGGIALMWRGGCIIRSAFLDQIKAAYDRQPELENLLFDAFFGQKVAASQQAWRRVLAAAVTSGLPLPAMQAALSYYDGYRRAASPANLIQAQRDFFGAHTYERVDQPRGVFFHTDWTGLGGDAVAGTYNA